MFGKKIKINKDLIDRAAKAAEVAGYSSTDEFINHIIEKELAKLEGSSSEEDMKNRLKGLGYIS